VSGHNRWSKIKRQKEALGATKGKLFSKLIREITTAARTGGGDPAANARLRTVLDAARAANMPGESITRAVKKGTGELEGVAYEEAVYEGYGPGGVALIVECLTDNRNRTAGDVRSTFDKNGGHLAAVGAVAWNFEKRGVIEVRPGPGEDAVTEAAIEAGAEDVVALGAEGFEVRTAPSDLHAVATALEARGLRLGERRTTYVPKDTVRVTDPDKARTLTKLIDHLDDLEDVQHVHANFEMDDDLMSGLA
jgi:YebC/PmpR family DNA-binding regulatory protein